MPTINVNGKLRIKGATTGGNGGGGGTDFISVWDTTLGDGQPTITLPLVSTGNYNFSVDWGDGTGDTITAYDQAEVTHTYGPSGTGGIYTITITGTIEGWSFGVGSNGVSAQKITSITNIGQLKLGNEGFYFAGCSNLTTIGGTFDLTGTTNFNSMFDSCTLLTSVNGISGWDVSSVVNMGSFMDGKSTANYDYYDDLLNAWSLLTLQNDVTWGMGSIEYTAAGATARQDIIDNYSWTITDGGLAA